MSAHYRSVYREGDRVRSLVDQDAHKCACGRSKVPHGSDESCTGACTGLHWPLAVGAGDVGTVCPASGPRHDRVLVDFDGKVQLNAPRGTIEHIALAGGYRKGDRVASTRQVFCAKGTVGAGNAATTPNPTHCGRLFL